jgi:hypothetical protein
MELKAKIKKMRATEAKLVSETKELISGIVDSLAATEMPETKMIPNASVQCATVSFKTLSAHRTNLSPTYYISAYQVAAVKERLDGITSITSLISFLDKTLEDGHLMNKQEKIILNPAVTSKLREVRQCF